VVSGPFLQPHLSRLGIKSLALSIPGLAPVHRYLKDTVTAIRAMLLAKELKSLRQLAPGTTKKPLPVEDGKTLVRRGFARHEAGALVITIMGHAQLAFEITRASWFAAPV
jgi:hypothetical protein